MTHHDVKAFKKVAVLTGLTVLVGGAEISSADAATLNQHLTFNSLTENSGQHTLNFNQFNPLLGTLTNAAWNVDSQVFGTFIPTTVTTDTASFSAPGISHPETFATTSSGHTFLFSGSVSGVGLLPYNGLGTVGAILQLTSSCEATCSGEGWSGSVDLTYTYDPANGTTPLPAALPLFASGAAGLGFMGWLKRKVRKGKKQG